MKKKVLSIFLVVVILVTMLPMGIISASAETVSGKCGENLIWSYDTSTYTLTISGTGAMTDQSYVYASPWSDAYRNDIKEVIIDYGVTAICQFAFYGCQNLANVDIPDTVTKIDKEAFAYCHRLSNVTIPNSVTTIGEEAFYECKSLTSIVIPDSVKNLGNAAFAVCTNLTEVSLPEGITTIPYNYSNDRLTDYANIHYNCCYHIFSEYEFIVEPTCTEGGSKKVVCSKCGTEEIREVVAYGHDYGDFVIDVQPTCTTNGSKSKYCSRCGDVANTTIIQATGHNYSEWEEIVGVTCTTDGTDFRWCRNCDHSETKTITKLGHNYGGFVTSIEATCTTDGEKARFCSRCNNKAKVNVTIITATGHSYGDWEIVTELTCVTSGIEERVCSNCGDVEIKETPALGHDFEKEFTIDVQPTEGEDGSKSRHCTRCDEKTDITVIPALGYYSKWVHDENGWRYYDQNGKYITNKWLKDSAGWCYVGADGYCVTNTWKKDSKGWCYLDANGRMATNKWVKDSKGWCYVGANGYAVTNAWKSDSAGWCYLDSNGRMVKNSWVKDGGEWYYLNSSGYMVTGWKQIGSKWYYFNGSGIMLHNQFVDDCWLGSDGAWVKNYKPKMYSDFPAPDFGAMIGMSYSEKYVASTIQYTYDSYDLWQLDPDATSGSRYMELLLYCGYKYQGTTRLQGVDHFTFYNPSTGTKVLFALVTEIDRLVIMLSYY